MDPISKLSQLLETLRLRQQAAKTDRAKHTSASNNPKRARETRAPCTGGKISLDELNRRIGERIRRLEPEDRKGGKAAQIFVDSVLAWEFGEGLLQSRAFSKYAGDIHVAMTSDPTVRGKLERLLDDFS